MRLIHSQFLGSLFYVGAGALIAVAFQQTSLPMTAAFAAGGVMLFFVVAVFSWIRVQSGFAKAVSQVRDVPDAEYDRTGVPEFDVLAEQAVRLAEESRRLNLDHEKSLEETEHRIREEVTRQTEASASVTTQYREIQGFLASLDGHATVGTDGLPISCVEQLKRVFHRFRSDVARDMGQVLGCGREINRTTEELVHGAESQNESLEKTGTLAEQLANRVGAVCHQASEARDACASASDAARNSLEQVATLAGDVGQIKSQSTLRERKLVSLGQHIREVESIVQTIGTLLSRTDLLALNASIESVRAGEHGRGFAIVAEEVRAMSEQSAEAIEDIRSRLELVQLETSQSLSMVTDEHEQLDDVMRRVSESLEALEATCRAAETSSEGLGQINAATEEQRQLSRDIVDAVKSGAESARINCSRAQGANWKSKSFDDLGLQIESTLQRFGGSAESGASVGGKRGWSQS